MITARDLIDRAKQRVGAVHPHIAVAPTFAPLQLRHTRPANEQHLAGEPDGYAPPGSRAGDALPDVFWLPEEPSTVRQLFSMALERVDIWVDAVLTRI